MRWIVGSRRRRKIANTRLSARATKAGSTKTVGKNMTTIMP